MRERAESLRRETESRYAASYAQGRVYTHTDIAIDPGDIFVEDTSNSWADRLVAAALEQAYPTLPIDHEDFPITLTRDRVQALYRALFQGEDDGEGLRRAFGPGLGITTEEAAEHFDAGACRVVAEIGRELRSRSDAAPASEILRVLTDTHGLPPALAAFFVLAFVMHAHGEIQLRGDHRVQIRSGEPFVGDQLTWDLLSEVSLTESLMTEFGVVRTRVRPGWNTVLPYATRFLADLAPSEDRTAVSGQEARLVATLREISPRLSRVRDTLTELTQTLGGIPIETQDLDKLERLCTVSDFLEFYEVAQDEFEGPGRLEASLGLYRRLEQLTEVATPIAKMKLYLDRMTFGSDHQGLSMDRDQVSGRIELRGLASNPALWDSIEDGFRRLRTRYEEAYARHHAAYHDETTGTRRKLERLTPQIEALTRFGKMPELGEPVGVEIPQLFREVTDSLRTCASVDEVPSLDEEPYCGECRLPMNEESPARDSDGLIGAVEAAMGEYNRRLSSISVRQVLAHPTREQLDKFIDLLHVADPSALANVLDDEVVEFLRQFLGSR
jgi:hypothetical protein